jgi:hypothetical protein
VLRAVEGVAAAAMWPETPSLVPRLSGRAGSAIFVPTACRSVAGGLPAPVQVFFLVDAQEIVINPAAGQLYLSVARMLGVLEAFCRSLASRVTGPNAGHDTAKRAEARDDPAKRAKPWS